MKLDAWKRRAGAIVVVLCVVMAVPQLAGCHRTSDEEQIRQNIAAAAGAARDDDTAGVLDVVSEDFTGNDGDLDRHGLRQLLALRVLRHDSTGVLVGPVSVERQGDRLIATFTLTLTGGKPDSLMPDQIAVYAMTTAWRRDGSKWRCYNATWKQ